MIEAIDWSDEPRPKLPTSAFGLQILKIPIRETATLVSTVEHLVARTINPDLELHTGPKDLVNTLEVSSRKYKLRTPLLAAILVENCTLTKPIKPIEDISLSDETNEPCPDEVISEFLAYRLQIYNPSDAFLVQREVQLSEAMVTLGRGEPSPMIKRELMGIRKVANDWQTKLHEEIEGEQVVASVSRTLGVRSRNFFIGGEPLA